MAHICLQLANVGLASGQETRVKDSQGNTHADLWARIERYGAGGPAYPFVLASADWARPSLSLARAGFLILSLSF